MSEPVYKLGDWFSNNIPNWKLWLEPFVGKEVSALEIGSCEGRSAIWLLENVLTHSESILTCMDPFVGDVNLDQFKQNVSERFPYKVDLEQVFSEYGLIQHGLLMYDHDIIYVDGDHSAKGALQDAVLAWPLLRRGGVMIFDDYGWGDLNASEEERAWNRPGPVIDTFLSAYRKELERLPYAPDDPNPGWQVAVRKL